MTTVQQLVGEFIDAWQQGGRPDVAAFLERASPQDRDELAGQLATWLELAPTPSFDEPTRQSIRSEPALLEAMHAAQALREQLAERLPTLRERAGLAIGDVAARLTRLFALDDEQRAATYLEQIERRQLDESRLSDRLLDALAAILGADRDQLARSPSAIAGGAQAFFRADDDAGEWIAQEIDALSRAALAPAPEPMDELDRLFLGGPHG